MGLGTEAWEQMARRTNTWRTKREAGSGSYRRRGNVSWQLTVRDADGKRLTKTVKAANETQKPVNAPSERGCGCVRPSDVRLLA